MENETKQLVTNRFDGSSASLVEAVVYGIQEKKGEQTVSIDLREIDNAVANFFVVCQATSTTHANAVADSILGEVKKNTGVSVWNIEGKKNAEWILLDYSDVVVHIFLQDVRNFYKLEDLWADAEFKVFE